ncbi:MAG: hypothetical protein PHD58_07025 [Anaerolineales bacterium]|nr:hypothetical protein [Anaerolineales bacterium]
MEILRIDIGGSGIKGVVNTQDCALFTPRYRLPTPEPGRQPQRGCLIRGLKTNCALERVCGLAPLRSC